MKRSLLGLLTLMAVSLQAHAGFITIEVSDYTVESCSDDTCNQIDIGGNSPFQLTYQFSESVSFVGNYIDPIFMGSQVGTTEIFDSYFDIADVRKVLPFENEYNNAKASYSSANADVVYTNDYSDQRYFVRQNTLDPQYQGDPALVDFDNTITEDVSFWFNMDELWYRDEASQQVGQQLQHWQSFQFDNFPSAVTGFNAAGKNNLASVLTYYLQSQETFFFGDQMFLFDFVRQVGNTDNYVDFADMTDSLYLGTNGRARIVDLQFNSTDVNAPSSIALIVLSGALLLIRRRKATQA